MPYIEKENQNVLYEDGRIPCFSGSREVIFWICEVITEYLAGGKKYSGEWQHLKSQLRSWNYVEAIGILESAKLEFFRRMMVPYEERMKEKNGDVF